MNVWVTRLAIFLQREMVSRVSSIQRIYSFRTHGGYYSFNSFLEVGGNSTAQVQVLLCILSGNLPSTGIQFLISRVCKLFMLMASCIYNIHQQKSQRPASHFFVSINACWCSTAQYSVSASIDTCWCCTRRLVSPPNV